MDISIAPNSATSGGLVVVSDLNVFWPSVRPNKTDAPLSIDPNRVLPGPGAFQRLQTVAGRAAKFIQLCDRIEQEKYLLGAAKKIGREALLDCAIINALRKLVFERADH